jgi:hypothetical protein
MGTAIHIAVIAHLTPIFLIMKGHFKSLFQINTTPVPTVSGKDIPNQNQASSVKM